MEEVYVCKCGCKGHWTITADGIKCNGCNRFYDIEILESPVEFNEKAKNSE